MAFPWLKNTSEPLRTITLKGLASCMIAVIVIAVRSTGQILQPASSVATTAGGSYSGSIQRLPNAGSSSPTTTLSPTESPQPGANSSASPTPNPTPTQNHAGTTTTPTPSNTPQPTIQPSSTPSPTPIPTPTSTPLPTPTPVPTPTPIVYKYRNGTYSASGSYNTPGGSEPLGVSLQIVNDKVVASTVTAQATGATSLFYQNDFIANYGPYVNGKSLDTLSLGKVAMSSLTPNGFNVAASSIRAQAL